MNSINIQETIDRLQREAKVSDEHLLNLENEVTKLSNKERLLSRNLALTGEDRTIAKELGEVTGALYSTRTQIDSVYLKNDSRNDVLNDLQDELKVAKAAEKTAKRVELRRKYDEAYPALLQAAESALLALAAWDIRLGQAVRPELFWSRGKQEYIIRARSMADENI